MLLQLKLKDSASYDSRVLNLVRCLKNSEFFFFKYLIKTTKFTSLFYTKLHMMLFRSFDLKLLLRANDLSCQICKTLVVVINFKMFDNIL